MDNKLEDAVGLITAKLSVSIKEILTELINTKISLGKDVLTSDEAATYMGVSKSYLYKLTMERKIPHYKPMGKMVYFSRQELEQWLLTNKVATDEELSQQAQEYCINRKKYNK